MNTPRNELRGLRARCEPLVIISARILIYAARDRILPPASGHDRPRSGQRAREAPNLFVNLTSTWMNSRGLNTSPNVLWHTGRVFQGGSSGFSRGPIEGSNMHQNIIHIIMPLSRRISQVLLGGVEEVEFLHSLSVQVFYIRVQGLLQAWTQVWSLYYRLDRKIIITPALLAELPLSSPDAGSGKRHPTFPIKSATTCFWSGKQGLGIVSAI